MSILSRKKAELEKVIRLIPWEGIVHQSGNQDAGTLDPVEKTGRRGQKTNLGLSTRKVEVQAIHLVPDLRAQAFLGTAGVFPGQGDHAADRLAPFGPESQKIEHFCGGLDASGKRSG